MAIVLAEDLGGIKKKEELNPITKSVSPAQDERLNELTRAYTAAATALPRATGTAGASTKATSSIASTSSAPGATIGAEKTVQPQGTNEALGLAPLSAAPKSPAPEQSSAPVYERTTYAAPQSGEDYINKLYDAQREAALAKLKAAYDENRIAAELQREGIADEYAKARDVAAAESEKQKLAWNEYAAASGLSSGARGQAELARSLSLAGALNELTAAETKARREAEAQLQSLEAQYKNAAAQAAAEGDTARMQALYSEWTRVQEETQKTQQLNAQEALNEYNALYQRYRDSVSDERYANETAYERAQAAKKAASSSSSGSSGSSGTDYDAVYSAMLGASNEAEAYSLLLAAGLSNDKTKQLWKIYTAEKTDGDTTAQTGAGTQPGDTGGGASRMLTESEFNGAKSGNHPQWALWYHDIVSGYNTYEDYKKDYERYLAEVGA